MLGLMGKKPDHPMADVKSAQLLLMDLPKNDALKSLTELGAWLEAARDQEVRLDRQFEVIRLLDETGRYHERKLKREYYSAAPLASFQEKRLWMVLNEFSTQVLLAYLKVQVRYRNGDKGASAIKEMMPLMAVRGIHAARGMLKSAAVRHALFDQAIWVGLAEFYAHAEAEQYVDVPVAMYAGGAEKTSVRSEFAATLMWYASSFGIFGRMQMHLAERLIASLGAAFTVSAQHEQDSAYSFDLEYPMSPLRLGMETVPQRSLRFIGLGDAQKRLQAMIGALEKNAIPEGLSLAGNYSAEEVLPVAMRLAERLTWPLPARRNVRHNVKVRLGVACGLAEVLERAGMGLDFGGGSPASWQVEDISVSGIRCILPAAEASGVVTGLLVGIKPESQEDWGVGIVRRLNRDLRNSLHVGIEVLARRMVGVILRDGGAGEELHAVWLDNPGGNPGEVDLLMSPDVFSNSRSMHTRVDGGSYLLMPLRVLERGVDYERVRYRKMEEDAGAEGDGTG